MDTIARVDHMRKRHFDNLEIIDPYCPYRGNKGGNKELAKTIIALMPPGRVRTFVDLFGGTGVVGVNAFWNGRCERLVYNDFEYDLHLLMRYLHDTPIDEIVENQKRISSLFPQSFIGKDKESEEIWDGLIERYNATRFDLRWLCLGDNHNPRPHIIQGSDSLEKRVRENPDGYRIVDHEFAIANGVSACDAPALEATQFLNAIDNGLSIEFDYIGERRTFDPRLVSKTDRNGLMHSIDCPILLFTTMAGFSGTPLFRKSGHRLATQRNSGRRAFTRHSEEKLSKFAEGLQAVRHFQSTSSDFRYAFLPPSGSARPRDGLEQSRFGRIIQGLGEGDFVFIDPPYFGSSGYNTGPWTLGNEVMLITFCEWLDERGVKWLMTNNISYNDSIYKEWINHRFNAYAMPVNYNASRKQRDKGDTRETIIFNYPMPPSKSSIPKLPWLEQISARKKPESL